MVIIKIKKPVDVFGDGELNKGSVIIVPYTVAHSLIKAGYAEESNEEELIKYEKDLNGNSEKNEKKGISDNKKGRDVFEEIAKKMSGEKK